jgi:hypothetical protein
MNRRWIAVGLTLTLTLGLSGCETFSQSLRQHASDKDKPRSESDGEQDEVEGVKSEAPKGFFNNSRLSGAWSSEARDVERSLGVH